MATQSPPNPTTPSYYKPSETALLLLDFHKVFVENNAGPLGPHALSVAASMKKWAKAQGIHVIHCLIDLHSSAFPTAKDAERLTSTMAFFRTGPGDEATALLEDSDGETRFTRRVGHVSALKSPGLLEYLEEKEIKSLVLAGLSTSGCVMRTACAGVDAEFVVTVVRDGCADEDGDVHEALMEKVFPKRGYVYTSGEFCTGWENGGLGA